jgi:alpha-methylacyl-CoA racemase
MNEIARCPKMSSGHACRHRFNFTYLRKFHATGFIDLFKKQTTEITHMVSGRNKEDTKNEGALSGLKVIEVAAIGPVPFAGMVLADMGARVTRIDRIPLSATDDTATAGFENRGRLSIAIDLKNPKGIDTALRLIDDADVLLEGFRPGVMEKLGLGPAICCARNPGLVYGRMTGWGQSGPLSRAAGHDINYIALTGALHAMGRSDCPPSPPLNLVGDYGGGAMMLLVGLLAALQARHRSGQGQVIDAAMTDGAAMLMTPFYSMLAQGAWRDSRHTNFLDGSAHFYGAYECADGRFIAIGSIEPQFYRLLLDKCGVRMPEFDDQHNSSAWPTLRERLGEIFKTRSRAVWCELMEGTDVCFSPVLSLREAPEHPHNIARQTFVNINDKMQPAPAPRFDRTPSRASADIPKVGAHTVALLAGLGMDQKSIDQLIMEHAVYVSGAD